MIKEEMVRKIIDKREELGIKRSELAKLCGLSENFIRMFENGKNIGLDNLLKITKELNLKINIE